MLGRLKRYFKQKFCEHYWGFEIEDPPPTSYRVGRCVKCDKRTVETVEMANYILYTQHMDGKS